MCNKLREVTFSIGPADGYMPDLSIEEREAEEEQTMERCGFFHCWIKIEENSAQSGKFREKTVALVEEKKSGKMYNVDPDLIIFKQSNN